MSAYDDDDGRSVWPGVLFFAALVLGGLVFRLSANEQQTPQQKALENEKKHPAVTIHVTEKQKLSVVLGEDMEAFTVGEGTVVGSFRFIPVGFADIPGRRDLLVVRQSAEIPLNAPVKVRYLQVDKGSPLYGLNQILEIVEPERYK